MMIFNVPSSSEMRACFGRQFQGCWITRNFSSKLFEFQEHDGLQEVGALAVFTGTFLTIHFLFMRGMHHTLRIVKKATRKGPNFPASHCVSRTATLNERWKLVRGILHYP